MPLYRRLPKIVGKGKGRDGHQKTNFGLLKLSVLNKMPDNSEVPRQIDARCVLPCVLDCSGRVPRVREDARGRCGHTGE
jgi:hypothetical protein